MPQPTPPVAPTRSAPTAPAATGTAVWRYSVYTGLATLFVWLCLFTWPDLWTRVIWVPLHQPHYYPFHDMRGHLASGEAYAMGMDIIGKPNPLDLGMRDHLGTSWMLYTGLLGLKTRHFLYAGILSVLLFLVSTLLSFRPARLRDALLLFACLCCPPTLLMIHQANVDISVYPCLILAVWLLSRGRTWSLVTAFLLISAFIGFKFYPNMAFAIPLVCLVKPRTKLVWLLLAGACVCLYVLFFWREMQAVSNMVTGSFIGNGYGAGRLLFFYGIPEKWVPLAALASFPLVCLASAYLLGPLRLIEARGDLRQQLFFLGAGISCFCFTVTTNMEYRLIFLIPCLPFILDLWDLGPGRLRWAAFSAPVILLVLPGAVLLLGQDLVPEASYVYLYRIILVKQVFNWIASGLLGGLWLRSLWAHNARHLPILHRFHHAPRA